MNLPRLSAILILSGALAACSNSTQSLPATGMATGATGAVADGAVASVASWHSALHQSPLPSAGCYKASFPSTTWQKIACDTPPKRWYPPHTGHPKLGQNVGNGHDYSINVTPSIISQTIGSFPVAKDVKSVVSSGCCGVSGTNSYTFQLNSNFFASKACGSLQNCAGWSQFVYENPPGAGQGQLFIQDWLVPVAGPGFSGCPSGKGWQFADGGCVQNSPGGVDIPNVPISSVGSIIETGVAATSGDSVYMSVGKTEYGMKNVQGDGITDLSQGWQGSEFNIIGNAGGDVANFNSGAKISINIQAEDGVKTKPACPANSGTTGETNNLFFIPAPKKIAKAQYPSVEFAMSTKIGKPGTCTVAAAK
jgi:hypothetical protein